MWGTIRIVFHDITVSIVSNFNTSSYLPSVGPDYLFYERKIHVYHQQRDEWEGFQEMHVCSSTLHCRLFLDISHEIQSIFIEIFSKYVL